MIDALFALLMGAKIEVGPLSTYWPGDQKNHGELSCNGRLTWKSEHIALRRWREFGCRKSVKVCSLQTLKCLEAPVLDGGPYGKLKNGQWRHIADISPGLWRKLGKPRYMSLIAIIEEKTDD